MDKRVEEYPHDQHLNTLGVPVTLGQGDCAYTVKPGERLFPRGRIRVFEGDELIYDGPQGPRRSVNGNS